MPQLSDHLGAQPAHLSLTFITPSGSQTWQWTFTPIHGGFNGTIIELSVEISIAIAIFDGWRVYYIDH